MGPAPPLCFILNLRFVYYATAAVLSIIYLFTPLQDLYYKQCNMYKGFNDGFWKRGVEGYDLKFSWKEEKYDTRNAKKLLNPTKTITGQTLIRTAYHNLGIYSSPDGSK